MSQGTEQKMKRRLFLFLIFAPGIFFIVYWAAIRYQAPSTADMVEPPPQNYVELGQRVDYDGLRYRVYRGEKLFSDRIELQNNNLAIAEPGRVFVGLGITVENGAFEGEVELLDSLGGLYKPLDARKEVLARTFGFKNDVDRLLLFKVSSKAESYYLQLKNGEDRSWRFANTYRE